MRVVPIDWRYQIETIKKRRHLGEERGQRGENHEIRVD